MVVIPHGNNPGFGRRRARLGLGIGKICYPGNIPNPGTAKIGLAGSQTRRCCFWTIVLEHIFIGFGVLRGVGREIDAARFTCLASGQS